LKEYSHQLLPPMMDNSIHAHDQYTELKTIWIDLSDRAPEESVD